MNLLAPVMAKVARESDALALGVTAGKDESLRLEMIMLSL